MPEISQFTVPVTQNGQTTNVTYSFKDSTARSSSGASKVSTTSDGVVSQLPNTTGGFLKNDGTSGGTWTSISTSDLPVGSSSDIGVVKTSGDLFMNGVYEPSANGDGTEINPTDTTSGKAQLGRDNFRWSRIYGVTVDTTNLTVINVNGNPLGTAAYSATGDFLSSDSVGSSGSSGTSGWYNCRLYNGKIQYYNTDTTYSTTSSVTSGSSALVTSGGVYSALSSKVNSSSLGDAAYKNYTSSVTSGSSNLVTSGAVYTALASCVQDAGNLGSSVNLNNYTSTQFFKVTSNTNGPSNTTYGICLVLHSGNYTAQLFVAYLTTDKKQHLFVRFYTGSSWGDWIQCG